MFSTGCGVAIVNVDLPLEVYGFEPAERFGLGGRPIARLDFSLPPMSFARQENARRGESQIGLPLDVSAEAAVAYQSPWNRRGEARAGKAWWDPTDHIGTAGEAADRCPGPRMNHPPCLGRRPQKQ